MGTIGHGSYMQRHAVTWLTHARRHHASRLMVLLLGHLQIHQVT
jgi:hypothetical protein